MKIRNLLFMFLASILGGLIAVSVYPGKSDSKEPSSSDAATPSRYAHLASLDPQSIRDVSFPDLTFAAEKAVHCVVHVRVKSFEQTYGNIWDYFYGRNPQQVPREGFGSGVIVSADGYIVTNNHVVSRSEEIEVILNDKRSFTARIIGTDPSTDLALLKIDETNLPFLTFGDSEATRVGEWVLAVGNPFNLQSTVTAGIVSAKGRQLNIIGSSQRQRPRQQETQQQQQQQPIESFIQTDAAINQGNSGGALVNIRGELIGINTLIYTRSGDFSGNAFAIPATITQKVFADLKEFGIVQRAMLGISMVDIDNNLAKEKDIKLEGVYVASVTENRGAAAAGIKEGDVIISINNVAVNSMAEVQEQVFKYRPNDRVSVNVIRDKKPQQFSVTLRTPEGNTEIVRDNPSITIFGATFESVSQKEKQDLRINSGVKVKEVGQGNLRKAGVRNGYIITSVNDKPVNSVSDIQKIADEVEARGQIWTKGVYSNGQVTMYLFNK